MGSASNSNQYPWPPYESFKDCSQGVCSIYCPQWCYMIFPPPPPSDFGDSSEEGSGINFSPLIIALIGIVASAFILVTYYTIISKYCRRRAGARDIDREANPNTASEPWQGSNTGMEESLIKSIKVHKYKKNDGVVEGTDCSVCLSEFQENESLRLLPKCSHAFHVPCIDTWLKSHSSCPLCRSNIAAPAIALVPPPPPPPPPPQQQQQQQHQQQVLPSVQGNSQQERINQYQHTTSGSVLVVQDRDEEESFRVQDHEIHGLRRSVSLIEVLNSHSDEDDDDQDLENQPMGHFQFSMDRSEKFNLEFPMETGSSKGAGSGEQNSKLNNLRNGVVSLVKGPLGLKRSISTGRFGFARYAKEKNSIIPN